MKIIIDIFGADNSPHELVRGCVDALANEPDIELILTGAESAIRTELAKYTFDQSRLSIVDAPSVITTDDVPTTAMRRKTDSSLIRGIDLLRSDDSVVGMVSAGSTGAILAAGIFRLGRIEGIERPCLAALLPTIDGGEVCIVDAGANVDCRPEFLLQFGLMGSAYMRAFYGIESPRVALLSVGTEDAKGNELTHAALELLRASSLNFLGNMEARDALGGQFDVIVTDGFAGNVLVKSTEGTGIMMNTLLKRALMRNLGSKLGALLAKKGLMQMRAHIKRSTDRGAPMLGVNKILIKAHGSATAVNIAAAINQVKKMHLGGMIASISSDIAASTASATEDQQP